MFEMEWGNSAPWDDEDMYPFAGTIGPLARAAGIGLWKWDIGKDEVVYSRQLENMLGYDKGEILQKGEVRFEIINKQHLQKREQLLSQLLSGIRTSFMIEEQGIKKDGSLFWAQEHCATIRFNPDGTAAEVVAMVSDISESKTVEKHRKSEAKHWEKLAHSAGVAGWIWDLENNQIRLNQEYEELLGYSVDDINDEYDTIISFFSEKYRMELEEEFDHFLDEGGEGTFTTEIPIIHKNGHEVWILFTANVTDRDSQGNPTLIRGGIIDIDKRVRAEQQLREALQEKEQYNQRLQQEVKLAVDDLEKNHKELQENSELLECINDVADRLLIAEPEEFDGTLHDCMKSICQLVDADRLHIWKKQDQKQEVFMEKIYYWSKKPKTLQDISYKSVIYYHEVATLWNIMDKGNIINSSELIFTKEEQGFFDDYQIKSLLAFPIILQNEFWGFVSLSDSRDIRVFTKKEEGILRSGAQILVSGLMRNLITKNLIVAQEEAMISVKAKSEFLSRMSHEIRTPMNAIIGMVNIAKKNDEMERVQYCLDKIENSSHQLLGLINDILDMSKIDADKFEIVLEEFNFEKMLENIFHVIQVKLDEKQQIFYFEFQEPFTKMVIGDELRIGQVLTNLLSNAVKFTPEYGSISLGVKFLSLDSVNARLEVVVSDTGIGVPEEHTEALFDSFEQADGSITREYGGTGLGLAICKKIVSLMGGEIWAENREDEQGARFIFEIDIQWGSELDIPKKLDLLNHETRILVAEDTLPVLNNFQRVLNGFGLSCDTCSEGTQILQQIKLSYMDGEPYDFIFVDYHLLDIDGEDILSQLMEITQNQAIILMLSAAKLSEIKEKIHDLDFSHILLEPALPSSILNKLFEITQKQPIEVEEATQEMDYEWGDKSLLLVEDIEINREIVQSVLERTHIQVECAQDGLEAVEMFEKNPNKYDVILMDVQMPRLDGLEATRRIRALQMSKTKEVPIVAMTANAFKEDIQNCLEAGMNYYLSKTLDVTVLLSVLHQYLCGDHPDTHDIYKHFMS